MVQQVMHIISSCEDGEGAARAMVFAMDEAGITADKVDYINAHGTSTHANDLFEDKSNQESIGRTCI